MTGGAVVGAGVTGGAVVGAGVVGAGVAVQRLQLLLQ